MGIPIETNKILLKKEQLISLIRVYNSIAYCFSLNYILNNYEFFIS